MKKKMAFMISFLTIILCACNNSSDQTGKNKGATWPDQNQEKDAIDKLALLHQALDMDSSVGFTGERMGQEVEMEDALDCITGYEKAMYTHGFDQTGGLSRDLGRITTRKITLLERFAGIGLLDWMTTMIKRLTDAGQGKDVRFELRLGIYTSDFLAEYIPDDSTDADNEADLRKQLLNRITIFIVPVGSPAFKAADYDNITAFELGGLQP